MPPASFLKCLVKVINTNYMCCIDFGSECYGAVLPPGISFKLVISAMGFGSFYINRAN